MKGQKFPAQKHSTSCIEFLSLKEAHPIANWKTMFKNEQHNISHQKT